MRNQIDTIPVTEAFEAADECPFCFMERKAEQSTIRFVVGPSASYMEPDVRGATDKLGFCRCHTQKIYDYGNSLGAALILQTYMAGILEEFHMEADHLSPGKKNLLGKRPALGEDSYVNRLSQKVDSCFICNRLDYHMERYLRTFFHLLKDGEFRSKVENSKGFCLRHFTQLLHAAQTMLPSAHEKWFYETVSSVTEKNLIRVKEDLDWFIAKFDYRNAGADWKNSKDALSRSMQKLQGMYPADPPYKKD